MSLEIPKNSDKSIVLDQVEDYIRGLSLGIADEDRDRPWGGFFVIENTSIEPFINEFFPDMDRSQIERFGNMLSPKILVVAPHQKLSWQFHARRAEVWRVIDGPVGVVESPTDEQGDTQVLNAGDIIQHDARTRHRLVGLEKYGILAEIWQHTDPANPSNEDDIVRLEDSYGRES